MVGKGKGSFVPAPAPAPRPFGGVEDPLLYPDPSPLPVLNPALTYEVYATLGLQAVRGGVPLDLAIIGGIALPGARFTLLGSEPADWQRGFRLSGPPGLGDGPAAAAAQYGADATPQRLGLPAWVVAQRKDGTVGLIRGDWLRRTFSFSQPG